MPHDHDSPAGMTTRELRDAIERATPHTEDWDALARTAYQRASFPLSWLPEGATGSRTAGYGANDAHGSDT
jgi:hypothetical protein